MDFSDKSLGFCAYWHYSVTTCPDWTDQQRLSQWEGTNTTSYNWREAWEAAGKGAAAENEKRRITQAPKLDELAQEIDFIRINAEFSGRR